MKDMEMAELWKSNDEKLDKLLAINNELMEEITKTKAKSILNIAKPIKYLGIIVGIPWILLLDLLFILGWVSGGVFFTISVGAIALITKIVLGTYFYHLHLIRQVNYADTIVEMQQKITKIKTSTITVLRIAVFQLPFWTTWYLSMNMVEKPEILYWTVNLLVTSVFIYITIWLYRNTSSDSIDNQWIKWLFSDDEWRSVEKASLLLGQIDEKRG